MSAPDVVVRPLPSTIVHVDTDRVIQLLTPFILNAEPDLGLYPRTKVRLKLTERGITVEAEALP